MADTILTDPLGRTIVFHDGTWFGHVLKRHPELSNHRLLAEQAIPKPLEIRFSSYDPTLPNLLCRRTSAGYNDRSRRRCCERLRKDRLFDESHEGSCRMVTTDTVEGLINGTVSYHYDVFADVLYLRLLADMETPSIGEETDDGNIELHEETTGRLVGITVVSWWKRFGQGSMPDSLRELAAKIEPWARKVAA